MARTGDFLALLFLVAGFSGVSAAFLVSAAFVWRYCFHRLRVASAILFLAASESLRRADFFIPVSIGSRLLRRGSYHAVHDFIDLFVQQLPLTQQGLENLRLSILIHLTKLQHRELLTILFCAENERRGLVGDTFSCVVGSLSFSQIPI
ncbi:MAG: hypothetical protein ACRD7E_31960 [Bryobacteraceae bacterium]